MDVFVRLVIGFLDLQKISKRTYIYIYIYIYILYL